MDQESFPRIKLHALALSAFTALVLATSWDTTMAVLAWARHAPHPGHTVELPVILISTGWDTIAIMLSTIGIRSTIRRLRTHGKKV